MLIEQVNRIEAVFETSLPDIVQSTVSGFNAVFQSVNGVNCFVFLVLFCLHRSVCKRRPAGRISRACARGTYLLGGAGATSSKEKFLFTWNRSKT